MIIRYLLNEERTHYLQHIVDLDTKSVVVEYIKDSTLQMREITDISDILEADGNRNPEVQVAKKKNIWDFHFSKTDPYGVMKRRSISLFLPKDYKPIRAEIENNTSKTLALVDYLVNPLEVYHSALTVWNYQFDDIEKMEGSSDLTTTSPEITLNDQLKVGHGGNILLRPIADEEFNYLIGGSPSPIIISIVIDEFGNNDISEEDPLTIEMGANSFSFNPKEGIFFNGSKIEEANHVADGMKVVFRLTNAGSCTLFIEDVPAGYSKLEVSGFNTTPFSGIRFIGGCDEGKYTLIDECVIHRLINYKLDTVPPAIVQNVRAIAGHGEVYLYWDPNTEEDLDGYNVYVNGVKHNIELIKETEFQAAGITDGVPNRFVVTAVDKANNESPSTKILEITTTTTPEKEVYDITSYANEHGVFFFWKNPEYADFAHIIISRINLVDQSQIELTVLDNDVTEYVDTTVEQVGTYKYVLATEDAYGNRTTGMEVIQYVAYIVPTEPENPTEPEEPEE